MAYKSILTVVTSSDIAASALEGAAEMANNQDAHLDILSLGIDHSTPGYYYAGTNALIEQATLDRAREEAEQIDIAVGAAMEGAACRWASDAALAQIGTIQNLVGNRARFADLVVLPKPYGESRGIADEAVLEAALFAGNVPVLVLPQGKLPPQFAKIVIAWNQSAEALDAVRAALPLLQQAHLSNIVIIDPPRHSPDRSDPGGMLSQMLARHGVRAEISVVAATMPRTADVLARHCEDQQADLLVMGAYGHSRFREAIMGGATRDTLEAAKIPVFMSH
ncbi:universal stress protein [Tropicimonas isoalkanivorans]|uniref:Universal stress protein family protein n=1 Tax=Tropicimonas isoalkanivorans TaxID=441112 RepID=A0A1I1QRJ5_9RHOB|nr:universal stress protein [Tropicimonas isoalkanivorans]SFD24754.1 Universal stress protein family protein [Tropicimonas isoalkanivorans]